MRVRTQCAILLIMTAFLIGICTIPTTLEADDRSTGPRGINSQQLKLTGAKVSISQSEGNRPGLPGKDSVAKSNPSVKPTGLFIDGIPIVFPKGKDSLVGEHAEGVAGIMISNPAVEKSVANQALLYATTAGNPLDIQRMISNSKVSFRAFNGSYGVLEIRSPKLNGSAELTLFVDWSAALHNTLYCYAGNEGTGFPVPTDNFNGLTVGSSALNGGIYRQVASRNELLTATDGRHLNTLIAPGEEITTTALGLAGNGKPKLFVKSGTSFAAPHVTGVAALLGEFIEQQIGARAKNWDADARQHQVLKVALVNSADKLKDDGDGKLLGMEKEIVQKDGRTNWLRSRGHDDKNPLDLQMGTGQINANRAMLQLKPGKHDRKNPVPVIGWDFNKTAGKGAMNKYVFSPFLVEGGYVAISLAWDRQIDLVKHKENKAKGVFEPGDTLKDRRLTNLDVFLLPKGAKDINAALARSISSNYSIEHIFFKIPKTAEYEFWVVQMDAPLGEQNYAVAWQAVAGQCPKKDGK